MTMNHEKTGLTSLSPMQALVAQTFVHELRLGFVGNLQVEDTLSSFGISSLEVIRLLSELERKLGVWINDEHYSRCTSIASIAQVCIESLETQDGSRPELAYLLPNKSNHNLPSKLPSKLGGKFADKFSAELIDSMTTGLPTESCNESDHPLLAASPGAEIVVSAFSAITPLGIASPLAEHSQLWNRLTQGETAFTAITHFDPLRAQDHHCGMIAPEVCDLPGPADPGRLKALAVTAIRVALKAAGLTSEHLHQRKIALILGTTDVGGHAAKAVYSQYKAENQTSSTLSETLVKSSFNAFHAQEIAQALELDAKCITLGNASAASAVAIGYARDILLSGDYDLVIALGADVITESAFQGLFSLRTLAPEGCRPFHPQRRGIRISEGAGVLILEGRRRVQARHAEFFATVPGYGASHISENPARPDPQAITHAVQSALQEAGLAPEQIGYINLHGAGTIHGDSAEINGLRKVFGERLHSVPISSTKPSLGHCQGSAGIVEAIVVLLSLRNQVAPPTLGLHEIDEEFKTLKLFHTALPLSGAQNGLSISCGLGGTNTALVIGPGSDKNKAPPTQTLPLGGL